MSSILSNSVSFLGEEPRIPFIPFLSHQLYFHTWQRDSRTFQNPNHNNRSLAIQPVIRGPMVAFCPLIWSFLLFLLPLPAVKLSAVSPCSLPSSYSCHRSVITPAGTLCALHTRACVSMCASEFSARFSISEGRGQIMRRNLKDRCQAIVSQQPFQSWILIRTEYSICVSLSATSDMFFSHFFTTAARRWKYVLSIYCFTQFVESVF